MRAIQFVSARKLDHPDPSQKSSGPGDDELLLIETENDQMYLHRPTFRPWPTVFAIFLSWPLSGAIWAIPFAVQTIAEDKTIPLSERFIVALTALPLSAFLTTMGGGFPSLREGGTQTNQYLLILPVMAVLLVIASRLIRRGKRPAKMP